MGNDQRSVSSVVRGWACVILCGMWMGVAMEWVLAQPAVQIRMETRPTISRFRGFSGVVEPSALGRIDPGAFRLYVNGEDHSRFLRISTEPATGSVVFSYKPVKALRDGKNTFKVILHTMDGRRIERSWSQEVNPGSDPALAPFAAALKRNPKNADAHLQLAKGYEKKFLMEDAQEEYRRILEINPRHEEARQAYDRIFSLWGRKAIGKRGVIVDVTMEEGLIAMGGPLLFKVTVENTTGRRVTFSRKEIHLLDSQGNQLEPWEELDKFPRVALDQGWIGLDDYARLSYQLESRPFPPFKEYELLPKVTASGFLAFRLPSREARRVILVFGKARLGDHPLEFHFPFTRS